MKSSTFINLRTQNNHKTPNGVWMDGHSSVVLRRSHLHTHTHTRTDRQTQTDRRTFNLRLVNAFNKNNMKPELQRIETVGKQADTA